MIDGSPEFAGSENRPTRRVIRLVQTMARLTGAGWVAVMLRELDRRGWQYDVESCELESMPFTASEPLTVNIVGLHPDGELASLFEFLDKRSSQELSFASAQTLLPAELITFAQEAGALSVLHNVQTAKSAAHAVNRFFCERPLSSFGADLQQLPWKDVATGMS